MSKIPSGYVILHCKQTTLNLPLSMNHHKFLLFLHNKGHMFFPRADGSFGSDYVYLQVPEFVDNGTIYHQLFKFNRAHWKSLDSEEKRCDVGNNNYLTKCVASFLDNLIGCSMGIAQSDNYLNRWHELRLIHEPLWNIPHFRCKNETQLKTYVTYGKKLYNANDNEMFELTGCLSNCHKYKYKLEAVSLITKIREDTLKSAINIALYYPATEHKVYKQV